MAKTKHVRLTPEAADAADALAGDSILNLAGIGQFDRSEVVLLGCQVLSLLANDLVDADDRIIANRPHAAAGIEGDPRRMTDVVQSEVLDLVYNRWLQCRDARATDAHRVRAAKLTEAMLQVAEVSTRAINEAGSRDG